MAGILQTWRRDMGYHPHIHYIVPGGALSADGRQWLPHRYRDWLLPEKALAAQFKLRFKAELETLGLTRLVSPKVWRYDKKWVADCIPAGCGEQALKYVAPYVYRVAISNNRIEKLEDGMVTFRFKDGTSGEWKHLTLSAEEFIRRFLQHVLPRGFVKVRYYGFLSTRSRGTLLPVIRRLAAEDGNPAGHDPSPDHARLDPVPREHRCPQCGRTMILLRRFHPTPAARGPP